MAKIKCPNCSYTIVCDIETWEDDIRCPLCNQVVPVNTGNKTMKTFIENAVKPKTRKGIIMILTYIFSLGVVLATLNFAIEYEETTALYGRNGWRHVFSLRQYIILIMMFANWAYLLDLPFNKAREVFKLERRERMKETRRTSFLYYFTYMCIPIAFWYLFFRKFILLDLIIFYDGTKNEYLIVFNYIFYSITYISAVLCCYIPYLIYYGFNLNFGYSDAKRYLPTCIIINLVFAFIFFIFYYGLIKV